MPRRYSKTSRVTRIKRVAVWSILGVFCFVNPALPAGAQLDMGTCVVCHGEQGQAFAISVHSKNELTCIDCHGGDPSQDGRDAHNEEMGFRAVPRATEIPELCGGCHSDAARMTQYHLSTDQLSLYRTSVHGRDLYESADEHVATCVTCHGTHEIRTVTDPLSPVYPFNVPATCAKCHADKAIMSSYGLPWNTAEEYRESVHGQRLLEEKQFGAPSCSDCHGSHGAVPPGSAEVVNVCGNCHSDIREYFRDSPHYDAFKSGVMKECTTCHNHHDVGNAGEEMLTGNGPGTCGSCHDSDDPQDLGSLTARKLAEGAEELSNRIEQARSRILEAKHAGVFIEDEVGYINDARRALVGLGPLSHTVSIDLAEDWIQRGIAATIETEEAVEVQLRRYRDRKIFSTATVVGLFIIAILLSVRLRRSKKGSW